MDPTVLTQLGSVLRVLVPMGLAFAVGKGWISAGDSTTLDSALSNAAPALPAIVGVAAAVWGVVSHSKNSAIAQVAAMKDVSAVVATPGVANSSTFALNDKVITNAQAAGQVQTTGVVGPSS